MDWERIGVLMDAALDMAPDRRAAFLDEACGDDSALRDEINSLLAAAESDSDFLARSKVGLDRSPSMTVQDLSGNEVGGYRLLHAIGAGGMAEVYLAERVATPEPVPLAFKVLRPGHADLLRRFERERRILARLDHPVIARLIDSGVTADDRPWLAAEYVADARRLTEYCDAQHLGLSARLTLFRQLCEAVHYVHQNLVVHGDLKPSNVLVSGGGQLKLVDFGISRLIDAPAEDLTRHTGSMPRPLTPAYASPEQIRGESPTTASDVYSLGVLLYELLCGARPLAMTTPDPSELVRIATQEVPEPPSRRIDAQAAELRSGQPQRLRRELSGDLDNIVQRAMVKEPEGRYPSAAALAEDIGHYLSGLPVNARPVTAAYRLGKLLRRNPLASAASAVAAAALLAFVVGIVVFNARLSHQADELRQALARAQGVSDFMVAVFTDSDPLHGIRPDASAVEVIKAARARLDSDASLLGADRAALLSVLSSGFESTGEFPAALEAGEAAVEIYRELGEISRGSAKALKETAKATYRLGEYVRSVQLAREALAQARRAVPGDLDLHCEIRTVLATALQHDGQLDEAERVQSQVIADRRGIAVPDNAAKLASELHLYGNILMAMQRFDEAEPAFEESVALRRDHLGDDHPLVAFNLLALAFFPFQRGDLQGAAALLSESTQIISASLGPEHPSLFAAYNNLADVHARLEQYAQARAAQESAIRVVQANYAPQHPRMAESLAGLGRLELRQGRVAEAIAALDRAVEIASAAELRGNAFLSPAANLVQALLDDGHRARAAELLERCLARAGDELPAGHSLHEKLADLAARLENGNLSSRM